MIVVIGKKDCKWCDKAKQFLEERELKYVYLDYHESETAKSYIKSVGATTVPQIWLGSKNIGGYEELIKHYNA